MSYSAAHEVMFFIITTICIFLNYYISFILLSGFNNLISVINGIPMSYEAFISLAFIEFVVYICAKERLD